MTSDAACSEPCRWGKHACWENTIDGSKGRHKKRQQQIARQTHRNMRIHVVNIRESNSPPPWNYNGK
jgi:hypothetical protein